MIPAKHNKLVSKLRTLIRDYKEEHHSDTVIHSKELIDYLVTSCLKKHKGEIFWGFNQKASFEEKLGFLLDKELLTERLFDNCSITKGIRNPTVHHFSYPDKKFALGALTTGIELYYQLQLELDLPELKDLNEVATKLEINPAIALLLKWKRTANPDEAEKIHELFRKYEGNCVCIVEFEDKPATLLWVKFRFAGKELLDEFNGIECIEKANWITVPQLDKYPMVESFPQNEKA